MPGKSGRELAEDQVFIGWITRDKTADAKYGIWDEEPVRRVRHSTFWWEPIMEAKGFSSEPPFGIPPMKPGAKAKIWLTLREVL
jgi:hypothetical protein